MRQVLAVKSPVVALRAPRFEELVAAFTLVFARFLVDTLHVLEQRVFARESFPTLTTPQLSVVWHVVPVNVRFVLRAFAQASRVQHPRLARSGQFAAVVAVVEVLVLVNLFDVHLQTLAAEVKLVAQITGILLLVLVCDMTELFVLTQTAVRLQRLPAPLTHVVLDAAVGVDVDVERVPAIVSLVAEGASEVVDARVFALMVLQTASRFQDAAAQLTAVRIGLLCLWSFLPSSFWTTFLATSLSFSFLSAHAISLQISSSSVPAITFAVVNLL